MMCVTSLLECLVDEMIGIAFLLSGVLTGFRTKGSLRIIST